PATTPALLASSEQEAHVDRVPELAARAAVLLDAAAFLDEADLAVESDRSRVVGEDAEAELVQTGASRRLDPGAPQRGADAAAADRARECHPELAVAVPARLKVQRARDLPVDERDERSREVPARGARLDVDRRLRGDAVALLGDGREDER